MNDINVIDLSECREFRQRLEGRAPALVHGLLILLTACIATAVSWAGFTKVNLVVVAQGRVRPLEAPNKVFTSISPSIEGRVAEVHFQEGDPAKKGDVLLRLDTEQLDIAIEKHQRTIQAGDEELAKLVQLDQLLEQQFLVAEAKASAELQHEQQAIERAEQRRDTEIAEAKAELESAHGNEIRMQQLLQQNAASQVEWIEAKTNADKARQQLQRAQFAVERGRLSILEQSLELVRRDFHFNRAELAARRVVRQGEVDAARKELAKLDYQRRAAIVRSPIDGIVTTGQVHVDDLLEPGKPVLEIAKRGEFRFEAAVASEDVGGLRTGMPVRIKFDAYDFQKYGILEGRVDFISPDSKIDPADTHQTPVYLVKIAVEKDFVGRKQLRGDIKLGMTGKAEIVTDRENLLATFAKQIRKTISFD